MISPQNLLRRPPALRRSWLFVPGMAGALQQAGLASKPDVLVADLEEFTAPLDRPAARLRIIELLAECRSRGVMPAVRINLLAGDGLDDLAVIMSGAPAAIFLPFAESASQIRELDQAISQHEATHGLSPGSTEIVPTMESALGIVRIQEILGASPRISACLLAAEDLSNDLGAERGPDSIELNHLRARFAVECTAARCIAIDSPFNYRDPQAQQTDLAWARRIGLRSKCATFPEQVAVIHHALTPSDASAALARDLMARYETARNGLAVSGDPVDPPDYHTARRLLARHAAFQDWSAKTAQSLSLPGETN